LLTAMRSGIERQVLPVSIGLWPIHISALFLGIVLLMKERHSGKKLKAKLPHFKRKNTNKKNQSKGQV
jgi:lipopolysaccharide export system permease protein